MRKFLFNLCKHSIDLILGGQCPFPIGNKDKKPSEADSKQPEQTVEDKKND